jgi:hypothetical protein
LNYFKRGKTGFWIFRFLEKFSIEICCYLNWWLLNDQTIIQGHHLDKHDMVDQMPLLVDQFSFWKSFNISLNLNSNSNRKTRDKFLDSNSNSNLELHFICCTWVHTLHLTLVRNTVTHLELHRAWTKYLRCHSNLGFSVRITPLRSTSNLER